MIAGVDEAGRGPLAGPVVAAAVILCPDGIAGVDDSKKLTALRREALFAHITERCVVGVGIASVEEIDSINIYHATLLAMQRAVAALGHARAGAVHRLRPLLRGARVAARTGRRDGLVPRLIPSDAATLTPTPLPLRGRGDPSASARQPACPRVWLAPSPTTWERAGVRVVEGHRSHLVQRP